MIQYDIDNMSGSCEGLSQSQDHPFIYDISTSAACRTSGQAGAATVGRTSWNSGVGRRRMLEDEDTIGDVEPGIAKLVNIWLIYGLCMDNLWIIYEYG